MDTDAGDSEFQKLIVAHAALRGLTVAEIMALIGTTLDLPKVFDDDPIKNLNMLNDFHRRMSQDDLHELYQQVASTEPDKTHWTFAEFRQRMLSVGMEKIKANVQVEAANRRFLEQLLRDS